MRRLSWRMLMDQTADRGSERTAGETGRHRTMVVVLALVVLVLMAVAWLVAAPAAGALTIAGALF